MWMVIGIALPLLCLTAIENIPTRPTANITRQACPGGITSCGLSDDPEVIHQEAFEASLMAADSATLVKVKVVQPLKSAFTLAYLGSPEQPKDDWQLLGSIDTMGDYEFTVNQVLDKELVHSITFYDALKEQVLNHLTTTVQ